MSSLADILGASRPALWLEVAPPRGANPAMALELLVERVAWWAEIFETPCVAYAESIEAVGRLARAGADFVALVGAIWNASSPVEAAGAAHAVLAKDAAGAR